MAVKKVGSFNIHETPAINQNEFDVETYLNANWGKTKEAVNNNAEELMQAQKDISTLKEDNKTNKSSIDVLEKSNETINKSLEDIDTKDKKQDEDVKANKESIKEIQAENERLREDIKSIATIGEASGENIHLEDSSEARCEIEICGNQQQETREGYNLLKPPASKTENGITFTMNKDGSITVNGTATANVSINFVNKEGSRYISFEAGTYRLTGCPQGGSSTTYRIGMNLSGDSFDTGDGATTTITTAVTNKSVWLIVYAGITVNNLTFYPMLVKGTENKTFEQYGASPSIDFSSNIKCVNADFKIDIANKNFLNITSPLKTHSYAGLAIDIAEDGMFTINGTSIGARWPDFIWGIGNNTVVHSNCKYYFKKVMKKATFSMKIVSGNISGRFAPSVVFNDDANVNIGLSMTELSKSVEGEMTGINRAYFSIPSGTTFNNFKFYLQLEEDLVETEYKSHQSQSYTIDVQQEMLEGDTFVRQDGKWYEKHCWEKMLLNGTEKAGVSGTSTNEILAIVYDINNAVDGFGYSNCFLYSYQVELNKMTVYNDGKSLRVNVSKMQFADLEAFTTKLKELYEAGTPVIIYYKLAEPTMLECTEAQSKVLDEIYSKAHTYKNITNISAESSEVNPIVSLKYLKDVETEHNKLQAQINEIKELLSSTETSSLLLDNIQKDLESEA